MKATAGKTYALDAKVYALEDAVGIPVIDSRGKRLGQVEDFVVYRCNNHPAYAVVALDAELGLGDELFVFPSRLLTFHYDERDQEVFVDVDPEQLKSAPVFDHYRWPDVVNPTWAAEIEILHHRREVAPDPGDGGRGSAGLRLRPVPLVV